MIDSSVRCILAPAVSNLTSGQNDRVGIVAYADASSIDGCPLIFALAYAKWVKISIWIGAEANTVSAHLSVIGIHAATHARAGIHLSIIKVFALTFSGNVINSSVRCILTTTVSDLTSCQDN